jgi:Domain of unknown function (DUF4190)
MRQCPKCNAQFADAWMSFCPDDGMILVDPSLAGIRSSAEPGTSEDATLLFHAPVQPGSWATPDVQAPPASPWRPPGVHTPPPQPWRPPPPPAYVKPPSQALGVASMIVGILGLVFGVLCFGPVIGIVALILGIVALIQHKKTPQYVGGKPFAVVGIVTGSLSLLIFGGMMLFFILANL